MAQPELVKNQGLLDTGLKNVAVLYDNNPDYRVGVQGFIQVVDSGYADRLPFLGNLFSSFSKRILVNPELTGSVAEVLGDEFEQARQNGSLYNQKTIAETAARLGIITHSSYSEDFRNALANHPLAQTPIDAIVQPVSLVQPAAPETAAAPARPAAEPPSPAAPVEPGRPAETQDERKSRIRSEILRNPNTIQILGITQLVQEGSTPEEEMVNERIDSLYENDAAFDSSVREPSSLTEGVSNGKITLKDQGLTDKGQKLSIITIPGQEEVEPQERKVLLFWSGNPADPQHDRESRVYVVLVVTERYLAEQAAQLDRAASQSAEPFRPTAAQLQAIDLLNNFSLDPNAETKDRVQAAKKLIQAVRELIQPEIADLDQTVQSVRNIRRFLIENPKAAETIWEILLAQFYEQLNDEKIHLIPDIEETFGVSEVLGMSFSEELLEFNGAHGHSISNTIINQMKDVYQKRKRGEIDEEELNRHNIRLAFLGYPLLVQGNHEYRVIILGAIEKAWESGYQPPWVKLSLEAGNPPQDESTRLNYDDLVARELNVDVLKSVAETNPELFMDLVLAGKISLNQANEAFPNNDERYVKLYYLMDYTYSAHPPASAGKPEIFYSDRVRRYMAEHKREGNAFGRNEFRSMIIDAFLNAYYLASKDEIIDRNRPIEEAVEEVEEYLNSDEESKNKTESKKHLVIASILHDIYDEADPELFTKEAA